MKRIRKDRKKDRRTFGWKVGTEKERNKEISEGQFRRCIDER